MTREVLFGAVRALMASTLVLATVTLSSSCVSILDLDDFLGAAETFCEHLTRCFGSEAYPGCTEHVSEGLEGANPEARAAWLTALTDDECLAKCSAGLGCLDQNPICNPPGDGCGQLEHCCGFQEGTQSCEGGNCCLPDGQLCDEQTVCCTGCDPATDTCGGTAPCVGQGESCEIDKDCCSNNCRPDGRCGLLCRERGTDCVESGECCTGICEGGLCACRADNAPCTSTDECCSPNAVCSEEGICDIDAECIPTGDVNCNGDGNCCDAADGVVCRAGTVQNGNVPACCAPNGVSGDGEECCSGESEGGTCCSDLGGGCAPDPVAGDGNGCCADRECVVIQEQPPQCCTPAECGNPCTPQSAPLRFGGNCTAMPSVTQECVNTVCKTEPNCCCVAWTQACVALLGDSCTCPAAG